MLYSFKILGVTVYSYALLVFIGISAFLIYGFIVLRLIEKEPPDVIYKTVILAVPSIAILAVVAFALNSLFHSIGEGRLVLGGITWAGGVLGAFVAFPLLTHFFMKEKRGEEISFFSRLVPGIALGHGFGRIGCFLAGCCYGAMTSSPIGVVYPAGSLPATLYPDYTDLSHIGSVPLLPVQLFEAGFEFLLFAVMIIFYRRLKSCNMPIYLICYGAFRFVLEFFRGDDRGGTGLFITPSQLMCTLFVIAGALLLYFELKRKKGLCEAKNE